MFVRFGAPTLPCTGSCRFVAGTLREFQRSMVKEARGVVVFQGGRRELGGDSSAILRAWPPGRAATVLMGGA